MDVESNTDVTDTADGVAAETNERPSEIGYPSTTRREYRGDSKGRQAYRRGAVVLGVLGVLALAGAVGIPASRSVLLALAGIGFFGPVLILYLTAGRFVPSASGDSIYSAFTRTGEDLVAVLDLRDERIYAPTEADGGAPARLFVPARADFSVPSPTEMTTLFVDGDDDSTEGIAVSPTGGSLYSEFRANVHPDIAGKPDPLAEQVADALVNLFELVEAASSDVEPRTARIAVRDSAYGPVDQFDHPVVSFSAVSLVALLEVPVSVTVTSTDEPSEYVITCTWTEQHPTS